MPTRIFRIIGSVTDAQTKKAVPNLRVQAADTTPKQVVLGSGVTDGQGQFQITAEPEVPANGVIPATLSVFQGTQALAATGDTAIPNLYTFDRLAVLLVRVVPVDQPLTDRVTVPQVITTMNFFHQSDFKGFFREGRDRTTAIGSLFMDSFKAAAMSVGAVQPLNPSTVRNRDVINQDPVTARRRLEEQKVAVASVQPYQPGLGTLGDVTSIAANIKPGDKVDLFVQDGVVKSYRVNSGSTTGSILGSTQTVLGINSLQTQLAQVQAASAQKDQVIAKLQSDVTAMRAAQDALAKVTPDRLAALEASVAKLQGTSRPGG